MTGTRGRCHEFGKGMISGPPGANLVSLFTHSPSPGSYPHILTGPRPSSGEVWNSVDTEWVLLCVCVCPSGLLPGVCVSVCACVYACVCACARVCVGGV